jgi:hypothetical protein
MWLYQVDNGRFESQSIRSASLRLKARAVVLERDWQHERGFELVSKQHMEDAFAEMVTLPYCDYDVLTRGKQIVARRASIASPRPVDATQVETQEILVPLNLRHLGFCRQIDALGSPTNSDTLVDEENESPAVAVRTGYRPKPYKLVFKRTSVAELSSMWTTVYSEGGVRRWDDLVGKDRVHVQCYPSTSLDLLASFLFKCNCDKYDNLDKEALKRRLEEIQAYAETYTSCFMGAWYVLMVKNKIKAAIFAYARYNIHDGGNWEVMFRYPAPDLEFYSQSRVECLPIVLNTLLSGACAIVTHRLKDHFERHPRFKQRILLPTHDFTFEDARLRIESILAEQKYAPDSYSFLERIRNNDDTFGPE